MANADRPTPDDLSWLERLEREPGSFDFHVALRRFEAAFGDKPRLGEAVRAAEEPLRLGQIPSSNFEPTAVTEFTPGDAQTPSRLFVSFLGMWGPHGPLPHHLTEYARDRVRHAGDKALTRLVDIFHHRMLLIFHRAWAKGQPTAALDRPEADRFATYIGSFIGLALDATRDRDRFPDRAKLFYASRLAPSARNPEGLRAIVEDYFGMPTELEEFVGEWVDVPENGRWTLGVSPQTGTLGQSPVLGRRVWVRGHKFRLVLGPLSRPQFERMLPNAEGVVTLAALVRLYTNDEWEWDIRLVPADDATEPMRLGQGARLAWTTRVGQKQGARENLVVDPVRGRTRRVDAPSKS